MNMNETTNTEASHRPSKSALSNLVRCGDCGEVIEEGDYGIEFCEDCMFNFQSLDLEDQLEALL